MNWKKDKILILYWFSLFVLLLLWMVIPRLFPSLEYIAVFQLISLVFFTIMHWLHYGRPDNPFDNFLRISFGIALITIDIISFFLIVNKSWAQYPLLLGILIIFFVIVTFSQKALFKTKGLTQLIVVYISVILAWSVTFAYLYALFVGFPDQGLAIQGLTNSSLITTWDFIYYSSTALYTSSYGNSYPIGWIMRLLYQLEVIVGAILHVIILGIIISSPKLFEKQKDVKTKTKSKPKKSKN